MKPFITFIACVLVAFLLDAPLPGISAKSGAAPASVSAPTTAACDTIRLSAFRERAQTRHRAMLAEQQTVSQKVPAYYAVEPENFTARAGKLENVRLVLRNLTHYPMDTAVVQLRYVAESGEYQEQLIGVGRVPAEGVAKIALPDGDGVHVDYELLSASSRALGITYANEPSL